MIRIADTSVKRYEFCKTCNRRIVGCRCHGFLRAHYHSVSKIYRLQTGDEGVIVKSAPKFQSKKHTIRTYV